MRTAASAQDPLFWAHHCMIDYCWAKWNLELENDNTSDQAWLDTTWNHFIDRDGNAAEVTALATVLMPLLSYQYESSAIGSFGPVAARTAAELRTVEQRVRREADVRFEIARTVPIADRARISIGRPFSQETNVSIADFTALVESDRARERIFVRVEYAMAPPASDFFVRVFINLPGANLRTPTDDPHFAGSFAFFGPHGEGHQGHAPKTEFLVYATDTLQRLRATGALSEGEPISVQLVAVPMGDRFERPDTELILERIDLIVSRMQVRTDRR